MAPSGARRRTRGRGFALVPALFMAQELASRLGLATRQGLAKLALHRLGRLPTVLLLAALTIGCGGTQSSAVAAAGLLTIILKGSCGSG